MKAIAKKHSVKTSTPVALFGLGRRSQSLAIAILSSSILSAAPVQASDVIWGNTETTWANDTAWLNGTKPVSDLISDIAVFNSSEFTFQPNADTTQVNGIRVGDGINSTGALTISGVALGIGSSGIFINANAGTTGITATTVNLGANQNWTNNSSSLLTVSSAIKNVGTTTPFTLTLNGSGSGGTTFGGVISDNGTGKTAVTVNTTGGITSFTKANTFTGGLTITSGTVVASNATALGATATVVKLNGGTLDLASDTVMSNAYKVTVAGNATILSNRATLGTGLNHSMNTLSLGGQLTVGSGANVNNVSTSRVTFNTFVLTADSILDSTNAMPLYLGGGTPQISGNYNLTIKSSEGGGRVFIKSSSTDTILRTSGSTILSSGTLTLNSNSALNASKNLLGDAATVPLVLNGGVLDLQMPNGIAAYNTTVGGNTTILSNLTGAGAAKKYVLGTLSIGSNTLSTGLGNLVTSGAGGVDFGATTLTGNSTFSVTKGAYAMTLTLGSLGDGGTARTITKSGDAVLTLASAASGLVAGTKLNISTGTVNSNHATALGSTAQVDVADGAIFNVGASQTVSALTDKTSSAHTASVVVGSGFTLTLGSSDNLSGSFGSVISGLGSIAKSGSGTVALGGTNTYTGTTTVSDGVLQFSKKTSLYSGTTGSWTAAKINVGSGATLALNVGAASGEFAASDVDAVLGMGGSATTGFQAGSSIGFDTTNAVGGSFEYASSIGNAYIDSNLGLTKLGTQTLVLSANNTYTGATTVAAGRLDVNGSLAAGSAVNVANGATLGGSGIVHGTVGVNGGAVNGTGLSMGAITFNGNSTLAGTTSSTTIAVATGTTTASGTATATSGLSVTNGATLTNNGTVVGDVEISGLLNGSGTVDGALTIKDSGNLAPGNSPGTTIVNGDFTVESGAHVSLQIDKALTSDSLIAGVGGNYDQIIVNGLVSLTNGSILNFSTLNNAAVGDVFNLIVNDGTDDISGFFTTVEVNGAAQTITNNSFTIGGLVYDLSYTANADSGIEGNDLTMTVVPEPSTWAMLVGGLGMLAFGNRFHRRAGI